MSKNNENAAAAVIAFVSGAVIGSVAALLLTPKPGSEVRAKLALFGENAADRLKKYGSEARSRACSKRTGSELRYDGGDGWI
ncbi:MAG TPA: YtxH domain-containing protein [Deltaproteobacteria bacterium]|nr:YtxH domain-containing protein [Deltaproteobacteria bacterium]HQB37763.1 YtxH domain-containing protein [Deltaproteobacteria bacterium]